MEIWKKVIDYEENYEISSYGRLKSLDRYVNGRYGLRFAKGKIIKPTVCTNGYLEYALHRDGEKKIVLAHRLVAQHFIPNPNNYPEVNHIDENIQNNRMDNLEWLTSKQNANYGTRNQRCKDCNKQYFKPVLQYDLEGNLIKEYETLGDASRDIKGDISAIIRVCKNRQNIAYGYIWKYKY